MTRDNLLQGGAPFVRDFLGTMAAYVRALQFAQHKGAR
jgi:hypothetical protein